MKKYLFFLALLCATISFGQKATKTTNSKLPFIGKKYFSFMGGTGQSVTIMKNRHVVIKDEPRREEPTITWEGTYEQFCKMYKISNGYIYDLDCKVEDKTTGFPCKARL